MRALQAFAPIALMLLVAGCGSTSPKVDLSKLEGARRSLATVDLSDRTIAGVRAIDTARTGAGRAEEQALETAFREMIVSCKAALAGFETKANTLSRWKIAIAATGAIVGGIVIPALTTASATANAVWISGLGGLAGVTNAAQQAMTEEGFTSQAMLRVRGQILADWKEAVQVYFDPDADLKARRTSLQKGLAACSMYAMTLEEPQP